MRKILGIAVIAISVTGGATVVLAQSSRDLTEVTGTEANRLRTQYGPYTPLCLRAARAPTMALVPPAALVIHCRT